MLFFFTVRGNRTSINVDRDGHAAAEQTLYVDGMRADV